MLNEGDHEGMLACLVWTSLKNRAFLLMGVDRVGRDEGGGSWFGVFVLQHGCSCGDVIVC